MQPIKAVSSLLVNKVMCRMRMTFCGLGLVGLCLACSPMYDHKGKTPLVEVDGRFLYREDLQAVMPVGLSADDSLLFADDYVRNWAEEVLLYDKAEENIPDNAEVERLVANYRKSLILHIYQQALIHQKLSAQVTEEEVEAYYRDNLNLFKVDRPLIKGLFIKVPLKAPHLADVRRWYRSDSHEAVEHLEKYSLRNAVKYEYFYDKWVPAADVLGQLPEGGVAAETALRQKRPVELADTAFHYFLNVTDYRAVGEEEPYEMARAHARDLLLNIRQVEFMRQVRDDLYRRAVENEEITYYDKDNIEE